MQRAEFLDSHLSSTGQLLGPLHGLPISLKDSFNIRGVDSSIGIALLAYKPAQSNASLVDLLLDAGAVLHCKTNVPQTLQALDSVNNLFGRTLNPIRRDVTAGGSSGGEGVLVAMGGSVLGVGTDIGGSIRIPAMCNGVYGFKPSTGRVPYGGQESGQAIGTGKEGLESCAGPIARSLKDCGFFLDVVERANAWERDPGVLPGRWWNEGVNHGTEKPLIGVVWRDGLIEPLPPVMKILKEVVDKVRKSGVEVVEIDAPRFKDCQGLANAFFGVEGGNHVLDLLEKGGEPLIPWLESRLRRKKPKTLEELRALHARKMELETDFLKIWKDSRGRKIDAFICPVAPHPVPPIDRWNGVSYTSSFVLLDYPAGTIPVRMLVKEDLHGEMSGSSLSSWDNINRGLCKLPSPNVLGNRIGGVELISANRGREYNQQEHLSGDSLVHTSICTQAAGAPPLQCHANYRACDQ